MIQAIDSALIVLWPLVLLIFCTTLVLLLVGSISKSSRSFVGKATTVLSYPVAFTVWLWGFLLVFIAWGWLGVIIGLVLLGVGVVPLGLIALILDGVWSGVGQMVLAVALVMAMRYAGTWMAENTEAVEAKGEL